MRRAMNKLYFGDNLEWLPKIAKNSIDLIYLDPPFNSQATYNILYKSPSGDASQAQHKTFEDSWQWCHATDIAFAHVVSSGSPAASILSALHNFMEKSDLMAYLTMMAARLIEMKRVLKPTGSLYLHCDSSASHYLKIILDSIFGAETFSNEIVWKRSTGKSLMTRRLPTNHDIILTYTPGENTWNQENAFIPYDHNNLPDKTSAKYSHKDADGRVYRLDSLINPNPNRPNLTYEFLGITKVWRWTRERMQKSYENGLVVQSAPGRVPQLKRYLDEQRGIALDDVWTDIPPLNSQAAERLGYQTQKPLALLERIISLSSRPGDMILDPFCGCGTAIEAAQNLGRKWIGIDITALAIDVVERRLARRAIRRNIDFKVEGIPIDLDGARRLFAEDPHEFQLWAVTLVDGQPRDGGKKGADKGIDGLVFFQHDSRTIGKAIISVKGGEHVHATHIRDLIGAMQSQGSELGLFVTLNKPTSAMVSAAREAGSIETGGKLRPRVQICKVEDLLNGKKPNLPPVYDIISAAASARRSRPNLTGPTPEDLRAAPQFRYPIKGGKAEVQPLLPIEEPILVEPRDGSTRRGRKRRA